MDDKRPQGRPKCKEKWVHVSFQLRKETQEAFDKFCEERCITRKQVLEKLVSEFMENNKHLTYKF